MTGRELYEITSEQHQLHGLAPLPHWDVVPWRERDIYEDMATEVVAADNQEDR